MASEAAAYKDVASKADTDALALEAEEKRIAVLEAELTLAQARVEAAEARHRLQAKKVEEELAKPLEKTPAVSLKISADGPSLAAVEAKVPSDAIDSAEAPSKGLKNTASRSEREVRRDKWNENKAAENRVKNQSRKLREKQRLKQRDERQFGERHTELDQGAAGAAAAAPDSKKAFAPESRERNPLFESDEVKQGAKSLAERLASLKDLPNAADKKVAALAVLNGGRDNYFVAQPRDVLSDLEKRGLVEAALANELQGYLKTRGVAMMEKSAGIPPEEWLAHAQKVSGVQRKDSEPEKQSEVQYLKWIDRVGLVSAEAELDEAQRRLDEMLQHVDQSLPEDDDAAAGCGGYTASSADQKIDEDYAAQLQDQHEGARQSKGQKNTSALSEKVVSKEKWERDRGAEKKEFDGNVKKREAGREGERGAKAAAAEVDA